MTYNNNSRGGWQGRQGGWQGGQGRQGGRGGWQGAQGGAQGAQGAPDKGVRLTGLFQSEKNENVFSGSINQQYLGELAGMVQQAQQTGGNVRVTVVAIGPGQFALYGAITYPQPQVGHQQGPPPVGQPRRGPTYDDAHAVVKNPEHFAQAPQGTDALFGD